MGGAMQFKIGDTVTVINLAVVGILGKIQNINGHVYTILFDNGKILYCYLWRLKLVNKADRFTESKSRVEKRHLLRKHHV